MLKDTARESHESELERQIKEKAEFTATIAHELKTPLTSIIASAGLLSEEIQGEAQEPQRRLVQNILHSAHLLEERLSELLDVAKAEVSKLQLRVQPVRIESVIQDVTWQIEPHIKRKSQHFTVDLPNSLPVIEADANRLEQVLLNLLTNASKFTHEGENITLRARKRDDNLVIEVQDSGIGISSENQAHLFQPYYRVESDRQRYPGLGLGLALARQIVELHGGRIWVTSELGKGSTFSVSLPLKHREQEQA
jgi:signal transduction histidine kinase